MRSDEPLAPPELVQSHLNIDHRVSAALSKAKPILVGSSPVNRG